MLQACKWEFGFNCEGRRRLTWVSDLQCLQGHRQGSVRRGTGSGDGFTEGLTGALGLRHSSVFRAVC